MGLHMRLTEAAGAGVYLCAGIAALALAGCRGRSDNATTTTTSTSTTSAATAAPPEGSCPGDNGGLQLPAGFCATVFADSIGHARHIAVAANGDVYVNTWSGRYYGNGPVPAGGFLVMLRDTSHSGRASVITRFGPTQAAGGTGGTGIAIYKGWLYAEDGPRIVKYQLPSGGGAPSGTAQTVVSGLPLTGDHPMHPIAIDTTSGALYIDLGSATNSCQSKNRTLEVPGNKPCTRARDARGDLEVRREQDRINHSRPRSDTRRGSGTRSASRSHRMAQLYSTQHGRDQLAENWPKLYTPAQGQELPAEELLHIQAGGDYGWPECYFDGAQGKLVLAPGVWR